MRSRSLPPAIACGLALAMICTAPLRADPPPGGAAPARGENRTLAGFALLPPARFESPMPVTSIGFQLSAKIGSDDRGAPAAIPPVSWQLLSVTQSFDFSVRVHPRIAVVASVGGVVAAGVDDESFYDLGAEAVFRFRAGVTGVVAELPRTQIAAHFVVDGVRGTRFGPPGRIVGRFVEDGALPVGVLLVSGQSSESIRVSLSGAHVISRHLAVQGSVGLAEGFSRPAVEGEGANRSELLTLGAALGAELGPVAAQLEIDVNARLLPAPVVSVSPFSLLETDAPFFAALGVYSATRRELVIGGSCGVEVADGGHPRGVLRLELRYVF